MSLTRFNLFVAFAFTVMADPVSSVAYAIESTLRGLDGDLRLLVPAMALVVATIAVVAATYHQLIRRFPDGGGGPEGLGAAFGEGLAFVSLGPLIVDFTLTVAISSAAAASAMIAYAPALAGDRVPLAAGLACLVGAAICAGHRGRVLFATATLAFLLAAALVLGAGTPKALAHDAPVDGAAGAAHAGRRAGRDAAGDGAGDRPRVAVERDRAARRARSAGATPVRAAHDLADGGARRRAHPRRSRARRRAGGRAAAPGLDAARRGRPRRARGGRRVRGVPGDERASPARRGGIGVPRRLRAAARAGRAGRGRGGTG